MGKAKLDFDISLLKPEDLPKLPEVFEMCFGFNPGENYFNWKYFENPAGDAVVFVARYKDDVAGFYGVIPEYYMVRGKKTLMYQSMDTMTHPNYRMMGLFTSLARKTYQYVEERDGRVFVTGFPGHQSYHGLVNRLDWVDIQQIPYRFVHRSWFSFFKPKGFYQLEQFNDFSTGFDAYFKEQKQYNKPIAKYLNPQVLKWRIDDYPKKEFLKLKVLHNGALSGFCILEMEPDRKRAFVTYISVVDGISLKEVLRSITQYIFAHTTYQFVYSFEANHPALLSAYKKAGYVKNPFNKGWFSYKNAFTVYGSVQKVNDVDWFNADNFDLQPIIRDY